MKKELINFATNVKDSAAKHSPEILTGIGIAGMLTTTVLAVQATPKAMQLIENKAAEMDLDPVYEKLTVIETVKAAWKPYIPAAISGVFSIACLVGASSENAKRNAALATAYKLSETAFSEYKEKVIETIGEKKESNMKEKIGKDRVDQTPVNSKEVIITSNGNTLCLDWTSKRYFRSDVETLKKAENILNKRILDEMFISLNDFYSEVGLEETGVGDDLGWEVNRDGLIDLDFSTQMADNGEPCIVVDFRVSPRYDYSRLG